MSFRTFKFMLIWHLAGPFPCAFMRLEEYRFFGQAYINWPNTYVFAKEGDTWHDMADMIRQSTGALLFTWILRHGTLPRQLEGGEKIYFHPKISKHVKK